MIRLSPRLAAAAAFASGGKSVADIGTDHGYLPVYLAQLGKAERIVASDLRAGPLSNAMRSAEEYGVSDRISFAQADGLAGLGRDFDTVVIAGMGGDTIVSILAASPWTKDGARLVLQPQSKTEHLTRWLSGNGYAIADAALAEEGSRLCLVLAASGGKAAPPRREADLFAPEALFARRDPLLPRYLASLEKKFALAAAGMARGAALPEDYADTEALLRGVRELMEEAEKWQP